MSTYVVPRDGLEPLSPELVLIDDALAVAARSRLVAPEDTLARIEHDRWRRRLAALEGAAGSESAVGAAPSTVLEGLLEHASRRRRPLLAAGAAAASVAVALLLGVNVNLRGAPAGASSEAETAPRLAPSLPQPTITEPTPSTSAPAAAPSASAPRPAAEASRTFAWAPVAGATAYHVELFRGERRVFARDVTQARFVLETAWTYGGRMRRLEPGTYRWNVWPVVSGLRRSQATVQAELVVP